MEASAKVYYGCFRVFLTISVIFFNYALVFLINQWIKPNRNTLNYIVEFLFVGISTIFTVTFGDKWLEIIAGICTGLAILLFYTLGRGYVPNDVVTSRNQLNCITLCRSSVYIITAVCISAVDFSIFPSHLCKTKEYGTGLMDVGIGLFVFSMGIVQQKMQFQESPWILSKSIRKVTPLIVLGVCRTLVLNAIDYVQVVTEYGLHWNAFLTIGITKFIGDFIGGIFPRKKFKLFAFLLVLHEVILQIGMAAWVMDLQRPRDGFIEANREGLVSIPGFVCIYLASVCIGEQLALPNPSTYEQFSRKSKLISYTALCCLTALLTNLPITHVSRRVANMGYCLWILEIGLVTLVFGMCLEKFALSLSYKRHQKRVFYELPTIVKAVNFNALLFFLVSNVLTGCINIFLKPSGRTPPEAFVILVSYMFLNCIIVLYLYKRNIKVI